MYLREGNVNKALTSMWAVVAAAAMAMAMAAAAPANAERDDWGVDPTIYLERLANKGFIVNPATVGHLIGIARMVCLLDNQGYSYEDIEAVIAKRENLFTTDAIVLEQAAAILYCPHANSRIVPYR
jgi:hypothetical protein